MRNWYALKTHPRREAQVNTVLSQRGIEVFCPQVPRWQPGRRSAAFRAAHELLFPGYLFARLDIGTDRWLQARSAPGVSYFLGPPGAPTVLPDDLVDEIRARADAQCSQGWQPRFSPGDRVSVEHGPLRGMEAVFDGTLSAAGRVRILLQVVGRLVAVDLHVGHLRHLK